MFRNQAGKRSRISKAIVYPLSSAIAALAAGTILGAVGDLLPPGFRWFVGGALGAVAIVVGSLELFGQRIQPLQHDCQTPRRWLHKGPLLWAVQNGLTLGFGATSRIGFLLWYAIPLGALLFGSPILGATIYGTYGLVRGVAAPLILLYMMRQEGEFDEWLILHKAPARVLAAGQLVLLGVVVVIALGP